MPGPMSMAKPDGRRFSTPPARGRNGFDACPARNGGSSSPSITPGTSTGQHMKPINGAGAPVRLWPRVLGEAPLICFICWPVDVPGVMLGDEDPPFRAGQASNLFRPRAGGVENRLPSGFAIDIGPGIDGIAQDVVDGRVARLDPADLGAGVHLQGELEPFGAEPQPDPSRRSHLGEAGEDAANGGDDGFVGIEANLAVGLAPNEADRQPAAQFAPRGLVLDSAVEASSQYIKFCLAHCSF